MSQVKARGTKVPEVWYSSPYCTPEAEIARGNEDSWSSINDGNAQEAQKKKKRIFVSVEPSTDSWALGILTYAMLTGSHPWAETASDCRSYLKYQEWFDQSKGPDDELDVWGEPEPEPESMQDATDMNKTGQKNLCPTAPQFACFTQLASSFFQSLLHPRPQFRGRPEEALRYLGGDWMMEKRRVRLEKEKCGEKGAIRCMKEMEGRGER